MLDPKILRKQSEQAARAFVRRGFEFDWDAYRVIENERKSIQLRVETLQAESRKLSKAVSEVKQGRNNADELLKKAAAFKRELEENEQLLKAVLARSEEILMGVPNLPHESVVDGRDDDDNAEIRYWGKLPVFAFEPRDHVEILENLKLLHSAKAAKVAAARFAVLSDQAAQLHRALICYMLDVHTWQHGYQEMYVPCIAAGRALEGTGQLPKFKQDLFEIVGDSDLYLIPTAEVPLTNLVRGEILNASDLPLKLVAHTPCFRSEAGSYGKDTRGILRQHQFEKVELVQIVKAEHSWDALEELTRHAETILQGLELPYRVMSLCAGSLGFAAAKTYDIEVWLPGQNKYREISSCSNMTDFQARRMRARIKNPATGRTELVHTLNGSGLAVGRTLIAVIENGQDEQGGVSIPSALVPYMSGQTYIEPSF